MYNPQSGYKFRSTTVYHLIELHVWFFCPEVDILSRILFIDVISLGERFGKLFRNPESVRPAHSFPATKKERPTPVVWGP